jgi:hypothetical protein
MAGLHVVVKVADDYTQIESKISEVISAYDITSTELKFFKISPFGSNKSLLVFIYAGPYEYIRTVSLGLLSKVLYGISKMSSSSIGLVSSISNPDGGTSAKTINRFLSVLKGLVSNVAWYKQLNNVRPLVGLAISYSLFYPRLKTSSSSSSVGISNSFSYSGTINNGHYFSG